MKKMDRLTTYYSSRENDQKSTYVQLALFLQPPPAEEEFATLSREVRAYRLYVFP
jgi:hypothetical protein